MKDTKQKLSWIPNYEAAFQNFQSLQRKKMSPPFWMTFAESNNFLQKLMIIAKKN